jgi:hypothetical protein
MFEVWLGLFDSVLTRELPAETAAQWSALAHRIGRGLMFGLQGRPPARRPHFAETVAGAPIPASGGSRRRRASDRR